MSLDVGAVAWWCWSVRAYWMARLTSTLLCSRLLPCAIRSLEPTSNRRRQNDFLV